jgi:hypothetical protein
MFEKVVGAHFVKPAAGILVLNGNIGKLSSFQTRAFLQHCSRLWKSVIYIPGPYELRESFLSESKSNVHYLNNSSVLLNGYRYIGTPYITKGDRDWFHKEHITHSNDPIVSLTYEQPCMNIINELNIKTWIYGSSIGGSIRSSNGATIANNGRGSICGLNDFDGAKGWRRDAFIG